MDPMGYSWWNFSPRPSSKKTYHPATDSDQFPTHPSTQNSSRLRAVTLRAPKFRSILIRRRTGRHFWHGAKPIVTPWCVGFVYKTPENPRRAITRSYQIHRNSSPCFLLSNFISYPLVSCYWWRSPWFFTEKLIDAKDIWAIYTIYSYILYTIVSSSPDPACLMFHLVI